MAYDVRNQAPAVWPVFLKSCFVLVDLIDRDLQRAAGLQLAWFDVLAQLAHTRDGRMPMKQLAETVLLSKSGVTRLVDRMVDAGLIFRESCATDGRVVYAVVTSKGKATFNRAAPLVAQGVNQHFSSQLSPQEAQVMFKALSRVLSAAQDHGCRLCARPPATRTKLTAPRS